jgi:hypothetical protein
VQYWEYTPGGPDPHRNPPTYSPPLNQPGTQVQVYGWAVPSTTDPKLAGHPDRVIVDVELYATPTFSPTPRSVIGLPSGRFEVLGAVQDYNHGPFEWTPGGVVNLRKVTG